MTTDPAKPFQFELLAQSLENSARAGRIHAARGVIDTPAFMPVGTQATVKSLTPEDLYALGVQIILANTYHLYLRPGHELIAAHQGLHHFMHWDRSILTDSGGYQVFSLARLRQITDEGVLFQSHIDGSKHLLTPEKAMEIQTALGSDIMMCLDECPPFPSPYEACKRAVDLTSQWARRCKARHVYHGGALFGIVQGGMFDDLRARAAGDLIEIGFEGYALGGLSVGEPREIMLRVAAAALPLLPHDRPRYVMGVGKPEDLVELVSLGADMFDCVLPTRNARNGQLFTSRGAINICNACHRTDGRPVEEGCLCYTCRFYSRAYLRHLFLARELLAYRLNTIHNIHYFMTLMDGMRRAIREGRFDEFRRGFYAQRTA